MPAVDRPALMCIAQMSPSSRAREIRTGINREGIGERAPLGLIQFLLGHVSIETTEQYLGCKQKLRVAVHDHIGLEPDAVAQSTVHDGTSPVAR